MNKGFYIQTFGCQMNERDSETISGMLAQKGYLEVDSKDDATVAIINTCSIRENAAQRFFGTLGQFKKNKEKSLKEGKDYIVCLCGCMMQEKHIVDTIKDSYPWVDIVFGTHNIHRFPDLLEETLSQGKKRAINAKGGMFEILPDADGIVENLPAKRMYDYKAFVTIMYGCNNFCTFCIVPYTRGREKSRTKEEIVKEINGLVSNGCKEVTLLGQNVNSYIGNSNLQSGNLKEGTLGTKVVDGNKILLSNSNIDDNRKNNDNNDADNGKNILNSTSDEFNEKLSFPKLLKAIEDETSLERLRFMTSHPKDLSDELVEAYRTSTILCDSVHLPVQSGSSKVLKNMNRRYTREDYLTLVDKLREARPGIAITTDIIVGFPGETEEDFLETLSLVKTVEFDSAFTFLYSVRRGTPAEKFDDQIPEEIKHERFNRLVDEINIISEKKNKDRIGKIEKVLVEGYSKTNKNILTGRTSQFKTVNFTLLDSDRAKMENSLDEKMADKNDNSKTVDRRDNKKTTFTEKKDLSYAEYIGKIIEVKITDANTFSLTGCEYNYGTMSPASAKQAADSISDFQW